MPEVFVLEDDRDAVRTLTLNRPEKLNALTGAFVSAIIEAVERAEADDSVRVVVLTGAGRAFCAGRDLTDMAAAGEPSRSERLDDLSAAGRHVLAFHHCSKPIVAAINGVAVGGGLSLALNADIRLMAEGARLVTGYQRRGLSPDGGMSYALPRLVGLARATELILSGRDINSEEALRIGLVAAVFPDEQFQADVASYSAQLAEGGPIGLAHSKRLLLESLGNPLETQLRREMMYLRDCLSSEDVKEGLAAFRERRTPRFQGR